MVYGILISLLLMGCVGRPTKTGSGADQPVVANGETLSDERTPAGQLNEAGLAQALDRSLFPMPFLQTQRQEWHLFAGRTPENEPCFVTVSRESSRLKIELQSQGDIKKNTSTWISIATNPRLGGSPAELHTTPGHLSMTLLHSGVGKLPERDLMAFSMEFRSSSNLIRNLESMQGNFTRFKENSSIAARSHRVCNRTVPFVSLDEVGGAKWANEAAQRWNLRPRVRQTGEVQFKGCQPRSTNTITCQAAGTGNGPGDEPVLTFIIRIDAGGQTHYDEMTYKN